LRVREPALLDAEFGALAERTAVRLLPDERDPLRFELARDALQPSSGTRKVRTA
jgi:hypothetical protein